MQAHYAYRSIAQFVKHVTRNSPEHLERNPFPELHRPPEDISPDDSSDEDDDRPRRPRQPSDRSSRFSGVFSTEKEKRSPPAPSPAFDHEDVRLYKDNEAKAKVEVSQGKVDKASPQGSGSGSGASSPGFNNVSVALSYASYSLHLCVHSRTPSATSAA